MSVSPKREFLRGLREKLKHKIRIKDEGEDEEKEFASQEELQAALSEDKSSLIQETELSIKQEALRLSDPCKYIKCLFFLLVQFRRAHFTPIFQEKFAAIW